MIVTLTERELTQAVIDYLQKKDFVPNEEQVSFEIIYGDEVDDIPEYEYITAVIDFDIKPDVEEAQAEVTSKPKRKRTTK